MFLLKKILTALILPPTSPLLLALLGLWLARRRPRLGRLLIALGLVTLLLLSMGGIANGLLRSLETASPPSPEQLAGSQAIVILAGGNYRDAPEYGGDTVNDLGLERLRYGARLARRTGLPIALSGGAPSGGTPEAEALRETLATDFGIAARWVESQSLDTAGNAGLLAPILGESGIRRIVLVTHAWHMRRAQQAFEKQGLTVVPAPTRYTPQHGSGILRWLPSGGAMRNSQIALHEWLGIVTADARAALALP